MKNIKISFLIALAILLTGASVPFLLGHTDTTEQYTARSEVPYAVTPPAVPSQATFAGETIDLNRYDLRERMDRELMSFTYMHSTTMLMIKRANRYFPVIEPILKENGIPEDFKYLMVIESNLNSLARSPAGAAGMWQFMQATGRQYGLEVNKNIDERYNLIKSTRAACRYLKDAYAKYNNWMTVAASYNAGQARISSALSSQLATKAIDLWLVEETSRYMFRLLAAKMVFTNPSQFGFILKKEQLYPPIPYKEVKVNTSISNLPDFAKKEGITYAQLKDFNPWLRDTSLENKSGRSYILHIPTQKGMNYDPKQTVPYNRKWVVD